MIFRAHASSSHGNLYLAECGSSRLAIEAGLRFHEIREALDFRVSRLAGCLVSHYHADHARAARDLIRASVDVYASRETWDRLRLNGHRALMLQDRQEARVGPWRVLPFAARHDATGAMGFYIEAPDGDRLLFSCDTAYVPHRFSGLTHVAVEANYSEAWLGRSDTAPEQQTRLLRSHMSVERAIRMLFANDLSRVREIWLLHLSDDRGHEDEFRRAVESATGKPVHIAPRRRT